jgi:hypothetical protein
VGHLTYAGVARIRKCFLTSGGALSEAKKTERSPGRGPSNARLSAYAGYTGVCFGVSLFCFLLPLAGLFFLPLLVRCAIKVTPFFSFFSGYCATGTGSMSLSPEMTPHRISLRRSESRTAN